MDNIFLKPIERFITVKNEDGEETIENPFINIGLVISINTTNNDNLFGCVDSRNLGLPFIEFCYDSESSAMWVFRDEEERNVILTLILNNSIDSFNTFTAKYNTVKEIKETIDKSIEKLKNRTNKS